MLPFMEGGPQTLTAVFAYREPKSSLIEDGVVAKARSDLQQKSHSKDLIYSHNGNKVHTQVLASEPSKSLVPYFLDVVRSVHASWLSLRQFSFVDVVPLMSFSPFIQPHSSSLNLQRELGRDDLPDESTVGSSPNSDDHAQPHASLLTARSRHSGFEEKCTNENPLADKEIYSLFRHRKHDSISSDTRELPSCRSDDASGSSISLESLGSGGPTSPMGKLETHEFGPFSDTTTIHAHDTSTPLNTDPFESNGIFDFANFGTESADLDFMNTNMEAADQFLQGSFDYDHDDSVQVLGTSDDSAGAVGSRGSVKDESILADRRPSKSQSLSFANHETSLSPLNINSLEFESQNSNLLGNKALTDFDVAPGIGAAYHQGLAFSGASLKGELGAHAEKPANPLNRSTDQFIQQQQEQQGQQQRRHQHQLQLQFQQRHQEQVPQPPFSFPKRRGLAINVASQDQSMPPETLVTQPLIPFSSPLHTQLNPSLGHLKRYSEPHECQVASNDQAVASHLRQDSVGGAHPHSSEQFRAFRSHNMLVNRRAHRGDGDAGEFYHNAFASPGAMNTHPMFGRGDEFHQGYQGFQRNKSKSKLPLADLFARMGLSQNHAEGKRREEKVMSILRQEGFELGQKTFIRDTDEPERKRIMGVIIEQTKEWGYPEELLEVIVHRGVYARMQSQLRRRRRMDNRQKARGGTLRTAAPGADVRNNHS